MLPKTRQSVTHPGLTVTITREGNVITLAFVITGRQAFYTVTPGEAQRLNTGHRLAPVIARHCADFAATLACKMEVAA